MGEPTGFDTANQTAFQYTSTRSIFSLTVGDVVALNVTLLSPVTPQDAMRQSIPLSYMSVAVQSLDGSPHDVQLYTDMTGGKH